MPMNLKSPYRVVIKFSLAVALLVATAYGASRLKDAPQGQTRVAMLVAKMVERFHISHQSIDDDVSAKFLERFLKDLDPRKLYLTKADVELLRQKSKTLDDDIKAGNVSFAFTTYKLFTHRLLDRIKKAQVLIDSEHDFNAEEDMVVDAKDTDWATEAELDERWRKQIKYDLLVLKLGDDSDADKVAEDAGAVKRKDEESPAKTLAEAKKRLHKRYANIVTMTEQTEPEQILEMFLTALTTTFDPHSSYMSASTLEEFQIAMRLKLQGIGAALRVTDGYTIVAEVVPGGAADADGRLKEGDKIIGVGQGEDGEITDVVEMKLSKVVKMIRGPKGTVVRLQVKPADDSETKIYDLTRQVIELKSSRVTGEIIDTGKRMDGRREKIGVINIPSFYRDFDAAQNGVADASSTATDVKKVLRSFASQGGVDGIIIDLRNNGGGALIEAIDVSGLFIDVGPVVQVKSSTGRVEALDDETSGVAYSGPLMVITNRLSASASEIFAGVIKDYKRGILVGDTTTHGKGTVQSVRPVDTEFRLNKSEPTGGALKITIQQFYRVNGDSTQNRGVTTDVSLPSLIDHFDIGESFLDNALEFDQVSPANYAATAAVNPEIISALKKDSQKRVLADKGFQRDERVINRYLKRKNRKTVSLNEEEMRRERDESKADKDEEKDDTEKKPGENKPKEIFPDKHYNNEVLAIMLDYIDLLHKGTTAKAR
ncbi:Tail-specific protease precursor [Symmachiella macrocystis]|uniref:Tail-specific protease n=1 Tax=Symmachiella macrocystis TaxID=2527985 RepID=A0A5C6BD47_9PLAN|nr:carboxy terminal-processing peptidase [Symmachiella macrocystis]TWU09199.1 Tail-specific protease precursor [Symmachiella macrocystis]